MFWIVYASLLVLWGIGLTFDIGGNFVHLLFVGAAAVLAHQFIKDGRAID